MGNAWVICLLFFQVGVWPGVPQQSFIEQSLVINVEVPVRVFKGATFIDDLTIDDFEILEDGIPQKIEACYLVNKKMIQRREEKKKYMPETSRHFYLFFEITDYIPKIEEAVEHFCQNVLIPGDNLVVVTPVKTYRLKDLALQAKTRGEIAKELNGLVRKDCQDGNAQFRDIVSNLTEVAKSLSASLMSGGSTTAVEVLELSGTSPSTLYGMSLEEKLVFYGTLLGKLDTLRAISQMKMLDFANQLSREDGQKVVFLFYQREYIPQVEPEIVLQHSALFQENPYIYQAITGVPKMREREMNVDVERVKRAYADASTAIHFLFITTPRPDVPGVYFEERSEDIFNAFREIVRATGGYFESSSNPAAMFRSALEAAENYYLLYYSPSTIGDPDRNFRNIVVRVKRGDFRVLHRTGYFLR
ncbi:MAG: hypothetical protein QHH14_03135 [Clostridiales bacterium]|nr:hypothetical protein [Clostridiales bacterium]